MAPLQPRVRYGERTGLHSGGVSRVQAAWPPAKDADLPRATFAMGCFWGPQLVFERVPGVVTTAVGYTGGRVQNPSYEAVSAHLPAIGVVVQLGSVMA